MELSDFDGDVRAALHPVARLLDGSVLGYQAIREGSLGAELDLIFVRAALTCSVAIRPAILFLTLPASALVERGAVQGLQELAADADAPTHRIVVEISELGSAADVAGLSTIVADLRSCGFRVATYDGGAAQAGMLGIAELRPDFIKLDGALTRDLHASHPRRALLVSLLSFATHINAHVVAEGIDTQKDLATLIGLGIQFGQGAYVGEPLPLPSLEGGALALAPLLRTSRTVETFAPDGPVHPNQLVTRHPPAASTVKQASLPHALSSAALALQAEHDPQRILAVIAEQLSLVVPVDDLSIYEADPDTEQFVAAFATGPQAEQIMADCFSMSVGLNGWAFALGTPQNLGNAGAHPAATTIPNTPFEHESLLLIPLVAGDHKLGMLNCRRMGLNRFTDEDLEAASLFGHTAAAAWHNAQLYEELARRAMTDGLTGLFNSRWLREAGEREIADCRRRGAPLSIVLVDLDHFKRINDTGGHAAGDEVLQRVADELRRTSRAGDGAVRLGGEEFVLVLCDADAAGAVRVATDLRAAMTKVPIPPDCVGIERITASFGIASFPEHGSTLAELVRAADVAMYGAKRDGRDRVKLALDEPATVPRDGSAVA